MKEHISFLLEQALNQLNVHTIPAIQIDQCKDPRHGDLASNVALLLAKTLNKNPRPLAEEIVALIPKTPEIKTITIAGPGFINFSLNAEVFEQVIPKILKAGKSYGLSNYGQGKRIYMEYVSSNPTGPLHVGHGRGAAYGACVADLLKAVGYQVHREYYVNDAGRQMQILALSIWLRYLELWGEAIELPSNAYQGEYVIDIAKKLMAEEGKSLHVNYAILQKELPTELNNEENKELYIDAFIAATKKLIGEENYQKALDLGLTIVVADMREDLEEFGVVFDQWFPESTIFKDGSFNEGIELLKSRGYTYEQEGALWFKATEFGDEKDRVLIRKNGQPTYFGSDVAYHLHKYNSGSDQIIDIFGSDHHGYLPRIRAFLMGLGKDPDKLKILLVQFAILYRGKTKVSMSTRAGSFVTLRELRHEVGNDAARFFYIMRKAEQHLDFDLELAKSKSNENPLYYIQYAHARICSIWRQLKHRDLSFDPAEGEKHLSLLVNTHEKNIMVSLANYPDLILTAARNYEPHMLAHYLQNLANLFHSYYNAEQFILEDKNLSSARLCLIVAVQQVLANGLDLLGLSAPEEM